MKRWLILFILCFAVVGCKEAVSEEVEVVAVETSQGLDRLGYAVKDPNEMFTDDDMDDSYEGAVLINLSNIESSAEVLVDGERITITQGGSYLLSGSTNRSISVSVDAEETVQLVLDNVIITTENFAAIYIEEAQRVKITQVEGSENILSSTGAFESAGDVNVDAVVFSRVDLVINGVGLLNLQTDSGNGISAKDDLIVYGTMLEVNASNHGLEANDSIRIASSTVGVVAGRDAIQQDDDNSSDGYIFIENSTLNLAAGNDGIQAQQLIQIESGSYQVMTASGVDSVIDDNDDTSYKGLKADELVFIGGGTFDINTADDAIHSNQDVVVDQGTITIQTLDDGIHADNTVVLNQPIITILESYEGIEGLNIEIYGGAITIQASDDGINASDASVSPANNRPGDANEAVLLTVYDGVLSVVAGGDAVDSNGNIYIGGGALYLSSPASGADTSIDFDGYATIEGGVVVATGSSGMVQNFSNATQGTLAYVLAAQVGQGTVIQVLNSSGDLVIDSVAMNDYRSIVLSSPEFYQGESYTVVLDSQEFEVTFDQLVTTIGGRQSNFRP